MKSKLYNLRNRQRYLVLQRGLNNNNDTFNEIENKYIADSINFSRSGITEVISKSKARYHSSSRVIR